MQRPFSVKAEIRIQPQPEFALDVSIPLRVRFTQLPADVGSNCVVRQAMVSPEPTPDAWLWFAVKVPPFSPFVPFSHVVKFPVKGGAELDGGVVVPNHMEPSGDGELRRCSPDGSSFEGTSGRADMPAKRATKRMARTRWFGMRNQRLRD